MHFSYQMWYIYIYIYIYILAINFQHPLLGINVSNKILTGLLSEFIFSPYVDKVHIVLNVSVKR